MATHSSFITKVITAGSFVVAAALIAPASLGFHGFSTNAFAEDDGSHEGGTSGHKGTKGGSDKGKGTDSGHGSKKDTVSKGQGGPDASSDGKGPKAGAGGRGGTKPVWASEGIDTSVEYGRLNIMRAPQNVRDQALAEALTSTNWDLYKLTSLTSVVNKILTYRTDLTVVRIDSPSEAIALYQALLRDGSVNLKETHFVEGSTTELVGTVKDGVFVPTLFPVEGGDAFVQAAIFLASASDKTKPIYTVTVTSVNKVLGGTTSLVNPINPLTNKIATDEEMAIAAEYVRRAIEIGHDAVTPVDPNTIVAPEVPTSDDVTPPPPVVPAP